MAKRQPKNQLPLDFSVRGDRIVLHWGQAESQQQADQLFEGLVHGEWRVEPAGEGADISSAQEIIQLIGHRLPYPETIKIAHLHQVDDNFIGFSAIYHQKGWVFVNAHADANDRHYHACLLTASLGLYTAYTDPATLVARTEQLIVDKLLPASDVSSFFREGISKIPPFLAADIADFFRVPFPIVLKRALDLQIITEEQYQNFITIKPKRSAKPRELYVAKEGSVEDLESQLFGEEDTDF
ncbi:hypothetical protein [Telluribacter sp. SYSU D00476]|uniref:hypothetical protein n=1 Tax=Telluribacter sp. SYSU D00476 TaxID=2811430 RepID=UPI001FF2B7CB|nr:hypothetical protein [Telluribacter sp. SYSU D00476]